MFKSQGESGTKSFKEILVGEIAERIREKVDKSSLDDELISHETSLREFVQKCENIPSEEITKLLAFYRHFSEKSKFPATLTSMLLHDLLI